MSQNDKNSLSAGIRFFFEGAKLMWHPSLRLYCLVPLTINLIIFVLITSLFVVKFSALIQWLVEFLPDWIAPVAWIAIVVVGVLGLMVYAYSFNLLTNIIAAPFYGRLAEKAEAIITGRTIAPERLSRMIPRVLLREVVKLLYFFSRGLVVILILILLSTIPVINFLAPIIGLAWSAWSMSIQYTDYAADNNQIGFKALRTSLWQKKYASGGFGAVVMFFSTIPIINIFAMPAAVTGGTVFWVRNVKSQIP